MRHVHLGLGRFHRAHQAYYLSNQGIPITAFSMRSADEADALAAEGGHYILRVLGEKQRQDLEVTIDEPLFIKRDSKRFYDLMVSPYVSTITVTVTENGYCATPDGQLDQSRTDLSESVLAWLVEGICRNQAGGGKPLAVISCDNLPDNGRLLERLCVAYAEFVGTPFDLDKVTFPNTMVDRIVPAGSGPKVVETEAFHQWVIEDRFVEERPPWEQPGLIFAPDVRPFEQVKLRLLNATQSFLAYRGQLKGYSFVHEAVADAEIRALVERLLFQEVGPVLEMPQPLNLRRYGKDLLRRLDNTALPHRLSQIATDGSVKLSQRILSGVKDSSVLRLCLDDWLSYMWLGLRQERDFEISDPYAERMRELMGETLEQTIPAWFELLGWNPDLLEPLATPPPS